MPLCQCGNDDISDFTYDDTGSFPVCTQCGFIQQSDNEFCGLADIIRSIENRIFDGKVYKGTYQRKVHLTERFREHNRDDPDILPEDLSKIYKQHEYLRSSDYFYGWIANSNEFGKKEIQRLLRSVDRQEGTKKYSRLYLERWNSLCDALEGVRKPVYTLIQASKVGVLFMMFSNLWDEWQNPRDRETRESWRFKDRKHIPNMNFLLCRIHDMLDIGYHNKCFPIPTTRSSLNKIKRYYTEMLNELIRRKVMIGILTDDQIEALRLPHYSQTKLTKWKRLAISKPVGKRTEDINKPKYNQTKLTSWLLQTLITSSPQNI
jgi:hypothetical protein